MSNSIKQAQSDPETHRRYCEASQKTHKRADYLEKLRKISSDLWGNNAYVDKTKAGIARAIDRMAELSRQRWNDENYRSKMVDIIRKRWQDDEFRKRWYSIIRSEEYKRKRALGRTNSLIGRGKQSQPEKGVAEVLSILGIHFETEYMLGFYHFDFWLPDYNVLIEVQGDYWHNLERTKPRDAAKATYIYEYFPNYKLVTIWEHETLCPGLVQDHLKKLLNITEEIIDVDFKKLTIKQIITKQAHDFLACHHYLRGVGRNGLSIGCFLGDELIAVCCFSSLTRIETANSLGTSPSEARELSRFCIKPGFHAKNLASWFLSRAVKLYRNMMPKICLLVSFADSTFGHIGGIYKASNWVLDRIVPPSYWYVSVDGYVMHKKTLWDHANSLKLSEADFAQIHGYTKVIGKEKYRYILRLI